MKCGYHTIGVIYDTKTGNLTKIGVVGTLQCHILHHIFTAKKNKVAIVQFSALANLSTTQMLTKPTRF